MREIDTPAREQPGGTLAVETLLAAALAPFGPWSPNEEANDLCRRWIVAELASEPLWAVRAGLRRVFLGWWTTPLPVELIEAVRRERDAGRTEGGRP